MNPMKAPPSYRETTEHDRPVDGNAIELPGFGAVVGTRLRCPGGPGGSIVTAAARLEVGRDGGDRGEVHDVGHGGARLQYGYRVADAEEDGPDGFGAAEPLDELVADVAGCEVGEDEDVGVALDPRVRVVLAQRSPRPRPDRRASRRRSSAPAAAPGRADRAATLPGRRVDGGRSRSWRTRAWPPAARCRTCGRRRRRGRRSRPALRPTGRC